MDLYYIITEECNLNCAFCIRNNLDSESTKYISVDIFKKSTTKLAQMFPSSTIVLTGGEPFMHPYIDEILQISMRKFSKVVINSNGIWGNNFDGLLKDALSKNVYLQLSIDGPERIHDKLRGKGTFSKCFNKLDVLSDYSEHISISTTVQKNTMKYIIELTNYLNQKKFHHQKVSPEQVCEPQINKLISAEKWNNFVDSFLPFCRYRVHIKKMFSFPLWDKFLNENKEIIDVYNNCGVAVCKLYITTACNVLPCTCFSNPLGNILLDNDVFIHNQISKFVQDIQTLSPICEECKYKRLCHGGCPGYSKRFWGRPNMGDPRCPIIQKKYE